MTKVLALDQATKTGWTFGGTKIPLHEWKSGHFKAPKRDELGERLLVVFDSVISLIETYQPDLLAYETPYDPTYDAVSAVKAGKEPRGGYSRETMNFLQGVKAAVAMAASRCSVPTESYPPQSWQATLQLPRAPFFEGEGDALIRRKQKWRKQTILAKVRSMGATVETEDEADSFSICLHACHGRAANARAQTDLFAREVGKL